MSNNLPLPANSCITNNVYYADCEHKYVNECTSPNCNSKYGIPVCNTTINKDEYYDKNFGSSIGSVISIPFLCSSLCITLMFTIVFGLYFKTKYSQEHFSFATIILLILFLCCLSSCLNNTKNIYVAKKTASNNLTRPCYSTKQNNIIN